MDKKQIILNFLKKEQLMVLSTINKKGKPQSALVGFSETPNLEIIFGTLNTTRKYENLMNNKEVSLVIGWNLPESITIQYEGVAEEITDSSLEEYKISHINKSPKREKSVRDARERIFKIMPKWIRYSDLSNKEIFEISL